MHKYLPHSEQEIQAMLEKIGVKKIDDLFFDVPNEVKNQDFSIPSKLSEQELMKYFNDLGNKNKVQTIFIGGGAYDHYTPSSIASLVSRQEFLTAYTPYQPEISQGTLQYIFEYQSIICELTGLDVANASLYDGATAASEAMMLACSNTKKQSIAVSSTINPHILETIKTYAKFRNIDVKIIESINGRTSLAHFSTINDGTLAGVIVASPNYYGLIEDNSDLFSAIHLTKGLAIAYVNPLTLSILKTPAEMNADIAVGDGQTLGIPLSFGGPYIGFMAAKNSLMRKIPGRIVGMSKDAKGNDCFVLTLQAREQHIRREKAVSNICSNQSLMALWNTIYVSLYGAKGLQEVCELNVQSSHYLYDLLLRTNNFLPVYDKHFFNEFVLKSKLPLEQIDELCQSNGFTSGIHLPDNCIMFAVTEKRSIKEIEAFAKLLGGK